MLISIRTNWRAMGAKLLTVREVEGVKTLGRMQWLNDGDGLLLEVSPTGSKRWVLRTSVHGRERRAGLGRYPDISLGRARELAIETRRAIRETGRTPRQAQMEQSREARRSAELELRRRFTVAAREWHKTVAPGLSSKHAAQCITTLEKHAFPVIGDMPLPTIKPADVLDRILRPMLQREDPLIDTASKVFQRIGAVFEYGMRHELCEQNPAEGCRRAFTAAKKQARKTKPKAHFAALDRGEVGELLRKIDNYPSIRSSLALRFIAYTVPRSSEFRLATWDEFELDAAVPVWRVPAMRMKARREHVIPLSTQAVDVLHELRMLSDGSNLVAPSDRSHGVPISDMALMQALRRMGFAGRQTVHGLRAIFSTLMREDGRFSRDAIEASLAHAVSADETEAAYMRSRFFDERVRLMQAYADLLDALKRKESVVSTAAQPSDHSAVIVVEGRVISPMVPA